MALGSFVGDGGLRIAFRTWAPRTPRAPRAAVVIVHTALDHSARYDEFAAMLVQRGMTVWAHDQRGHGHSDGDAGLIDRIEFAASDVGRLVELARGDHETPCFVVGHSMGAVVGLAWAIDHQDQLAGIVTTAITADSSAAPLPLRLMGDLLHLDRIGALISPHFPLLAFDSADVTSDPVEAAVHRADPLVHHGRVPMRTVSEIAKANRLLSTKRLAELHTPLLVIHGAADTISPPAASTAFYDAAGSADKTLLVEDDLRHDLFHEVQPRRRELLDLIGAWIDDRA